MNYSTGGSPSCFVCNRTAAKFDRMLNEWVCEGNKDCGVSRNTTKPVESSASPQEKEK